MYSAIKEKQKIPETGRVLPGGTILISHPGVSTESRSVKKYRLNATIFSKHHTLTTDVASREVYLTRVIKPTPISLRTGESKGMEPMSERAVLRQTWIACGVLGSARIMISRG
jgi:hypothetical protein